MLVKKRIRGGESFIEPNPVVVAVELIVASRLLCGTV